MSDNLKVRTTLEGMDEALAALKRQQEAYKEIARIINREISPAFDNWTGKASAGIDRVTKSTNSFFAALNQDVKLKEEPILQAWDKMDAAAKKAADSVERSAQRIRKAQDIARYGDTGIPRAGALRVPPIFPEGRGGLPFLNTPWFEGLPTSKEFIGPMPFVGPQPMIGPMPFIGPMPARPMIGPMPFIGPMQFNSSQMMNREWADSLQPFNPGGGMGTGFSASGRRNLATSPIVGSDPGTIVARGLDAAGRSAESMQSRTKRGTMAIIELSRAAEDFSVTAQTGGFQMGMRSAINNIAQFAFIINPIAGIIAGFAGAIAATAVPALVKWATAQDSLNEKLKKTGVTLKDLNSVKNPIEGSDTQRAESELKNIVDFDIQGLLGKNVASQSGLKSFFVGMGKVGGALGLDPRGLASFGQGEDEEGRMRNKALQSLSQTEVNRFLGILERQGDTPGTALKSFLPKIRESRADAGQVFDENIIPVLEEIEKKYKLAFAAHKKALKDAADEELEDIARMNERGKGTSTIFQQILIDEEIRQEKAVTDFMSGIVDQFSPDSAAGRRVSEQIKGFEELFPIGNAQKGPLRDILEGQFSARVGRRDRLEEISEREAQLQEIASNRNSVMGTIVGVEELGRRISQSAGGDVDTTKEELKKLREERKRIAEEEKVQNKEVVSKLSEIAGKLGVTENVFGVAAPGGLP